MDLWPSQRLIHAMDVLFVFSIYFSVGLYSQIQIFMRNNWYKAGLISEFSENTLILWLKGDCVYWKCKECFHFVGFYICLRIAVM